MKVALVTVGDELLAGETINTNAAWLGRELTDRGVRVERVTVVPDRVDQIAGVVAEYHREYDAVVVTGGLGPTHDDVTMEAVALAFDREVVENGEALDWLTAHGGYSNEELTTGTADLPEGSTPLHNESGVAPGAVLENVYVLPGVPTEMKTMFERIETDFSGRRRHVTTLHTPEPESCLVDRLRRVQEEFDIRVGSYPGDGVRVKLSGTDPDTVGEAEAWLRERIETDG